MPRGKPAVQKMMRLPPEMDELLDTIGWEMVAADRKASFGVAGEGVLWKGETEVNHSAVLRRLLMKSDPRVRKLLAEWLAK